MQLLTGQTHTLNSITTLTTPATSYNTTVIFRPWKSMRSMEGGGFPLKLPSCGGYTSPTASCCRPSGSETQEVRLKVRTGQQEHSS